MNDLLHIILGPDHRTRNWSASFSDQDLLHDVDLLHDADRQERHRHQDANQNPVQRCYRNLFRWIGRRIRDRTLRQTDRLSTGERRRENC